MEELRAGIDAVDEEIVRLLDRRAWLARRIGEIKHQKGLAAYAPARERAVLDRVAALSEGEFPKRGLQAVFREIISSSISLEGRAQGRLPRARGHLYPRGGATLVRVEHRAGAADHGRRGLRAGSSGGRPSTASCPSRTRWRGP